jgi:hypothetical protein
MLSKWGPLTLFIAICWKVVGMVSLRDGLRECQLGLLIFRIVTGGFLFAPGYLTALRLPLLTQLSDVLRLYYDSIRGVCGIPCQNAISFTTVSLPSVSKIYPQKKKFAGL